MTYKLKLAHTTANMNQFPSNATQPEKVLICHTILSVTVSCKASKICEIFNIDFSFFICSCDL